MTTSVFEEAVSSIHRGVLGVLTALLGMLAYGVAIRALPNGNFLLGGVAAVVCLFAVALVGFLFVEGLRDGAQ